MELKNLIAECTAYDFKVMLEENRPKSWLKSVIAFANGLGGSLFFGIDNDGILKGLGDVQHICEVISNKIRDYIDPLPEVEMIPHDIYGSHILQLKVFAGHYTPYYYVGNGQRIAFVRVGDESLPAAAEQMVRLVLKGSNKTYDSIHTDFKVEDYAFTILANTFKDRTKQEWDKKYLLSFGPATNMGNLTNAGALFADDCPLWQSRLYCTRWEGKEKMDAINDAEFTGNVLMLLREAMNFVKSNTKKGWEKLPNGRKNKPEYAERAVLEAMVNHFIHRDYTVMGGEVHLDIYDDRLTVTSPGGMYNGMLIQDLDISDVSSERRNPILANVMSQLDYMEKRGSGLTRICNETKALVGYKDELRPIFKSTPTQFQTIIFASSDTPNVGDVSETKLTERQQKILNLIKESPTITGRQMSVKLSVSQRTIERDLSNLQKSGILKREGKDNSGMWFIVKKNNTMNIKDVDLSGGSHVVILGAGASIASALRNPEKHGLSLPSMNDLPKVCRLDEVLSNFPEKLICDNFEATYSNLVEHDPNNHYLKVMNEMIYSYFSILELPDEPTIYDYLVMSLRDKDVIATFNWDPFLYQAWWRNYHHGSSPQMIYLHGNVAVGYNQEKHMLGRAGMYSNNESIYFKPTQLLFPVKHKDYNKDPFIRSSWQMLQDRLDKNKCNTHNVTIFGYSAPVTDVEALSMMKSAWGDISNRNLEQLEFIDIRKEEDVINSWSEFIHTHHYDYCTSFFDSSLAQYPRRTDEAFFCHFLPSTPEESFVKPNPIPLDFKTLKEMWDWYEPLIAKEKC